MHRYLLSIRESWKVNTLHFWTIKTFTFIQIANFEDIWARCSSTAFFNNSWFDAFSFHCGPGGTRTHTRSRGKHFKCCVYTYFTTGPTWHILAYFDYLYQLNLLS